MHVAVESLCGISEIQSWEIGGELFSFETPVEDSSFEFQLKVEIRSFLPPPMRSKESQKLDGKLFSPLKEISKESVFGRATHRVTVVLNRTFLRPALSIPSTRSLFFPKEASPSSFATKTSQHASVKQAVHSFPTHSTPEREAPSLSRPHANGRVETSTQKQGEKQSVSNGISIHRMPKEDPASPIRDKQERHDREGRRERQSSEQESDGEEKKEKKEKQRGLKAISAVDTSFSSSKNPSTAEVNHDAHANIRKPFIEPPKLGVFSLYYILDKMGIYSESTSYSQYRQEVEANDAERTAAHKRMLDEMQKAIEKEKQTARWSTAIRVFSWIGSAISVITGAVMIATGVGAVAGAILIAGGVLTIGNQLLEVTGGWEKIVDILPGDDLEKKRSIVTWMQIGVAVLSLILAGAGIVFGGFSSFSQASSAAMAVFNGIVTAGHGVCTFGKGVEESRYKYKLGDAKKYELRLAELKHNRQDLMEKIEESPDRLLHYYESLSRNLGFLEDMNAAFQRAW